MAKTIKKIILDFWRYPYKKRLSSKIKKHSFTLISSNCIGGCLYHDLFHQFESPTINITIPNFLVFCSNLHFYLNSCLIDGGVDYKGRPIGILGDLEIHGIHFRDFNELKIKWINRCKRINWSSIYLITTDEFVVNESDMDKFDKLPFPKVCFVSFKHTKYSWQVYLPEFKRERFVGDSTKYIGVFGKRICEKHFDFVNWINNN